MSEDNPTATLRPRTLAEFTGQLDVVAQLNIILGGARARGAEVSPHLLFAGPPGLGKTTLAGIVAAELDLPLVMASGPAITRTGTLASMLVSLQGPTVVFVDEIHRLPIDVQEMLYSAMEDFRVDITAGEGTTQATIYPMELEPFVLVGATTEAGRLARPFLDRFGYVGRLDLYDHETLTGIVERSAAALHSPIDADGAALIAARARGTPRIANQLLGRVRDLAAVRGAERIETQLATEALDAFGVDALGLDKVDRAVLTALVDHFSGGPVGLVTLAAAVNEDPVTLEMAHEPYLMRAGLLQRTPRGRSATERTYTHLGREVPARFRAPEPQNLDQ